MNLAPDVDALCTTLKAACRIDDAIGGTIHLVSEAGYDLVAHNDLSPEFRLAIEHPVEGDGTPFSQALTERRRVAVRDMRVDPAFAPYRRLAGAAGIVAMQSTPVVHGRFLHGVLTTYYDRPYHPGPESMDLLDCCASIVALLLVANEFEHAIEAAQQQGGRLCARPQDVGSGPTRAAASIQALLSACEKDSPPELLKATEKKLNELVDELSKRPGIHETHPSEQESVEEIHCAT